MSTRSLIKASICIFVLAAYVSAAVKEQVLYSFGAAPDGSTPVAPLVMDSEGHLYGTTEYGGQYGKGTVFELLLSHDGWTEKILHDFTGGKDGAYPIAGLTLDKTGNLYGTALEGGSSCGCGIVFEMASSKNTWAFTVLHAFNGTDGADPSYGKLVFDRSGSIYGVTQLGGAAGVGTVFQLTPYKTGWKETVLYNFTDDAVYPYGVITWDGRLYGTTPGGGTNFGRIFELSPEKQGSWTFKTLFSFDGGENGAYTSSGLVADPSGNLYGTTFEGGSSGLGLVYQLVPQGEVWKENVLHVFDYGDGDYPDSLTFDSMGNLFGETTNGGPGGNCAYPGCGVIFQLSQAGHDWTYSLVDSFDGSDGSVPEGGLIIDGDGNLYGTTETGGAHNLGVVFEVKR
jgi:uncharacterized repeat protein (TIGR03803 family)